MLSINICRIKIKLEEPKACERNCKFPNRLPSAQNFEPKVLFWVYNCGFNLWIARARFFASLLLTIFYLFMINWTLTLDHLFFSTKYYLFHVGGGELYTWGSNENGCLGIGYLSFQDLKSIFRQMCPLSIITGVLMCWSILCFQYYNCLSSTWKSSRSFLGVYR